MDRLRRPRSLPVAPADPWAQGRRGHRGGRSLSVGGFTVPLAAWARRARRPQDGFALPACGGRSAQGVPLWQLLRTSHLRGSAPPTGDRRSGAGGVPGRCALGPAAPHCLDPAPRALPEQPPRVQMELKSCHWTASLKKLIPAHHQTVAATCAVFCKEMGECASGGRRLSSSGPGSAFWQIPG